MPDMIPQGTVYNNLEPDRLAGPKIPTIADNQPLDCMTFVQKYLLCMEMSYA